MQVHVDSDNDLSTDTGRLRFIESCCKLKAERENAKYWGAKCAPRYVQYQEVWPDAYFINVIRDGRDVLASQLNTGDFKTNPAKLAVSWVKNHRRFRDLCNEPNANAIEVLYEELVRNPEKELKRITDYIGIDYKSEMMDFHKKDLTIHTAGHMSGKAIAKPFGSTQIGRWKKDLSSQQEKEFMDVAGEAMALYGYC
jgi:hypothetical protein